MVRGDREVGGGAEVKSGQAADRPEAGVGAKDRRFRGAIAVIVPRYRDIVIAPEVKPGDAPDRPEAGGVAEDGNVAAAVAVVIPALQNQGLPELPRRRLGTVTVGIPGLDPPFVGGVLVQVVEIQGGPRPGVDTGPQLSDNFPPDQVILRFGYRIPGQPDRRVPQRDRGTVVWGDGCRGGRQDSSGGGGEGPGIGPVAVIPPADQPDPPEIGRARGEIIPPTVRTLTGTLGAAHRGNQGGKSGIQAQIQLHPGRFGIGVKVPLEERGDGGQGGPVGGGGQGGYGRTTRAASRLSGCPAAGRQANSRRQTQYHYLLHILSPSGVIRNQGCLC